MKDYNNDSIVRKYRGLVVKKYQPPQPTAMQCFINNIKSYFIGEDKELKLLNVAVSIAATVIVVALFS